MEQVGHLIQQDLQQLDIILGGAGTQTAALAFGGVNTYQQQPQKNGQE
jgi:hypothetical protein